MIKKYNIYLIYLIKKQNEINSYWDELSKYELFNQYFERDFIKAIEKSYFDYSLIDYSIYEQERRNNYIDKLDFSFNISKYVFYKTQIDPLSNKIIKELLYSRKPFYGMGLYFTDMLDFLSFYSGGDNYKKINKNYGKTLPINETFYCIGTEINYGIENIIDIYEFNFEKYYNAELDHFPTYMEIKKNYSDKMVERDYIHFARIKQFEPKIKNQEEIKSEDKKGKFIGNIFVLTEIDQMLPLYGLTFKRNEYIVIWRDPNFSGENKYSEYLKEAKMYLYKNENINVYFESCTEKALDLINRKKFNKIILISSIGLDLSGKTFVEAARKILGFDIMVLFFSSNNKHLEWIQNFPNALYTNNIKFYQEYIRNYNEKGLKNLKKDIEKQYKIKLKFTSNFMEFPKFVNNEKFTDLIFDEICPNFRKIIIRNQKNKKKLCMNYEGKVEFVSYEGRDIDRLFWYSIIINNEITFFSNNFYLSFDENLKIVNGYQYMKRWKYEIEKLNFIIYFENKNNILTENEDKAIITGLNNNKENQIFQFIDIL